MKKRTPGGRNLMILGFGAVLFATITTTASLLIYRNSGDIYLDRSRPGYLPDTEEVNEDAQTNTTYTYADSGVLNAEELDEYLKELDIIIRRIEALKDPYAAGPLSDESLGISVAPQDKDKQDEPTK